MTEFNIRSIQSKDLDEIAKIHKASFHDRALTQLGIGVIKRYYAWLLTGFSEIFPLCAVDCQGMVAGFCFAGIYAGSFSGFLQNNRWYLIGSVLLRPWLIFNSLVMDQIKISIKTLYKMIKRKLRNKRKNNREKHKGENFRKTASLGVLSIAVNPSFQSQGVGGLLMKEVETQAHAGGYTELHLSVHPDNVSAIKFYEKLGWQRDHSSENWDGKMFKKLI